MSSARADDRGAGAMLAPMAGVAVAPLVGASMLGDAPLGVLQRILLTTDATVVRLLEGFFGEVIRTAGLGQVSRPVSPADGELEPAGHETLLCRETLLQGSDTGRNYIYAEVCVVLDRLDAAVREGLLTTSEPIGYLLAANRIETFREVLRLGRKPAGPLGARFAMDSHDELLSRTYRIIAGGSPIMLLTEWFPALEFPEGGEQVADPNRGSAVAGS